MKFLKSDIRRRTSVSVGVLRSQPCRRVQRVTYSEQHFTGTQDQAPDDQALREDVCPGEVTAPGGDRAPDSRSEHRGDAQEIEPELESTAVRVRPLRHPDADEKAESHPDPGAGPFPCGEHAGSMAGVRLTGRRVATGRLDGGGR